MLTVIDTEYSVDVNKNFDAQSSVASPSNVIRFQASEDLEVKSRQKAIEAIKKKSQQLHW